MSNILCKQFLTRGKRYMSIVVSLWSRKYGEIRRFLKSYYEKNISMDEDVEQWMYVYNKPIDAVDIISAVIDNNDRYEINVYIQVDKGDIHSVTLENHNDIIRSIVYLYYEEQPCEV
jgi:hypothetical protein